MPLSSPNRRVVIEVASITMTFAEGNDPCNTWLTDEERTRGQSITSTKIKQQFLAGHFLVRSLASRVFGAKPEEWIYFQDNAGLRRLKCQIYGQTKFYVSISHAGDWIAAAISDAPVGIDIETFSKQRDFIAIARHVFSAAEISTLKSCNAEALKQMFYLYWTLKESAAKQYGAGLKLEISRAQSPVLVSECEQASMESWLCPDYVIALASELSAQIETVGICENAQHQVWKNISY